MEHNIIVNNNRQISNVVTALQFFRIHWHTIEQLANLVGAFNPLPDFTDEDLVMQVAEAAYSLTKDNFQAIIVPLTLFICIHSYKASSSNII